MRHAWAPKFQLSETTVHSLYCVPDIFHLVAGCFELQDRMQTRVDSIENYGVLELKTLVHHVR